MEKKGKVSLWKRVVAAISAVLLIGGSSGVAISQHAQEEAAQSPQIEAHTVAGAIGGNGSRGTSEVVDDLKAEKEALELRNSIRSGGVKTPEMRAAERAAQKAATAEEAAKIKVNEAALKAMAERAMAERAEIEGLYQGSGSGSRGFLGKSAKKSAHQRSGKRSAYTPKKPNRPSYDARSMR